MYAYMHICVCLCVCVLTLPMPPFRYQVPAALAPSRRAPAGRRRGGTLGPAVGIDVIYRYIY